MSTELEQFYAGFSERNLKSMHESARRSYGHDKNLTPQEKEAALRFGSPLAYYGTDVEKDWPEHVDAIEKALSDKNIAFTPILK